MQTQLYRGIDPSRTVFESPRVLGTNKKSVKFLSAPLSKANRSEQVANERT